MIERSCILKRYFDLVFSLIGLIIISPLLFVVAVWIKVDSSGPILFRQTRIGKNGKPFSINKFRSMYQKSESDGKLTIGNTDPRVTRCGYFIRKYKIDELPQLINVFLGDMSFVGPRPEVPDYIDVYPPEVKSIVLSVKPGITDNASIEMVDENEFLSKYENAHEAYVNIVLPLKQALYIEYVKNQSFWGDVIIILRTIFKIFSR